MIVNTIEVNGKKYKLQHPGNREYIRLKREFFTFDGSGKGSINMETILDYCFEHVVFPEQGPKLSLESVDLGELEEVWSSILPRFLRGELEAGSKFKSKKRSS